MRRFEDTHGERVSPTLIMGRTDVPELSRNLDAVASFRDLLVSCTVPLARSLEIIHDNGRNRVLYSNFFWVYPWMLDRDYEMIIAHTPAMLALHTAKHLRAQSSPELARTRLSRRDFDEPLLQYLLRRWTARYGTTKPEWADVALFRSLNMVNYGEPCLLPPGWSRCCHSRLRQNGRFVDGRL